MFKVLRWLSAPFSLFYGMAVRVRNLSYDKGYSASRKFELPVISVGNLAVGGAGKSPMAEYLVRLLKDSHKIAILSRGYGRRTSGFLEVGLQSTAEQVGDEPLQFKTKFPDVKVAVCESRVAGIESLQKQSEVVILDDAYQHRAVAPGLSILLFDYTSVFKTQMLLPAGNLREPLSGRKRADLIVVTKTPAKLSPEEKSRIAETIKPFTHQRLFYSFLNYDSLRSVYGNESLELSELANGYSVVLLTGIANTKPLIDELRKFTDAIIHHRYPDHHPFTRKNIAKLAGTYGGIVSTKKIIITTEKDAQRLQPQSVRELLTGLPVYYLPVSARIHSPGEDEFNQLIRDYVANRN
ncbi:MAG: tetraacyldisaccharide 4-kinase [Sphingobacteriaceae bacterium]|jgi:tetraacyldisaccharide 4'-kinase|nr:tetraacyldisaccharide 4-kinase [Sphingobacteriaceae bacterium]